MSVAAMRHRSFWRHAHFLHIHRSVQVMMQECSPFHGLSLEQ